jgi:dihydropteroate synthase
MKLDTLIARGQTRVMGILNTTPDSFSDGGLWAVHDAALRHAIYMAEAGADIIDIGGESTRPGAQEVSLQHELDRVVPLIESVVRETGVPVSVDTSKPEVMATRASARRACRLHARRRPTQGVLAQRGVGRRRLVRPGRR